MKIRRYPIVVAIVWLLIEIADIILAVLCCMNINFKDKSELTINNPQLFNVIFLILMFFAVFQFYTVMGHYQFSDKGVTFHFLLYQKRYRWQDFQYIVKLNKLHHRKQNEESENDDAVFLFSVSFDKENINSINSLKDQNGIFFRLPYSEKLEEMIVNNFPEYTDRMITDERDEAE
ncbi:MAG: hypothetical protein IJU14_01485 [Clostridia bacterium]|nr:hypothetical protein [Clostridia bacterium]